MSLSVFGQLNMIDQNKKWYNHIHLYESFETTTEVLAFSYDTTINDTIYKKLLKGYHGVDPPGTNGGFLREEAGEVYYRINASGPEKLIYDFSISPGNSIEVGNYLSFSNELEDLLLICDSIRPENYDDVTRQTIYLSSEHMPGYNSEIWIEGLGSKSGLLHNYAGKVGGDSYDLGCVKYSDELIYKRDELLDCIIIALGLNAFDANTGSVFPNPARLDQLITIQYQEEFQRFELYNIMGEVEQVEYVNRYKNTFKLNVSAGLYIYRVLNSDRKTVFKGKLQVNIMP